MHGEGCACIFVSMHTHLQPCVRIFTKKYESRIIHMFIYIYIYIYINSTIYSKQDQEHNKSKIYS